MMLKENPRRIAVAAGVLLFGACAVPDNAPSGALDPPAATRPAETVVLGSAITSPKAPDEYRAGWASRLIGEPVIDPRGGHLGLLDDFVFDVGTGNVRYAIVSNERVPAGERLVPVPLRLLHVTEEDGLLLDIAQERFDRKPWWAPDRWPLMNDSAAWGNVDRHWDRQPLDALELHRVSRLMGRYANDLDGRHLGRIVDVVLDLGRRSVHYAVLRLQGHPRMRPDHAFAVPVELLKNVAGNGRVQLDVRRPHLMSRIGTDGDEAPANTLRYLGVIDRDFGVNFPQEMRRKRSGAVGATR